MSVAAVIGRLRSPHQVIARKPDRGFELGPRVVLFLHWDRGGRVREALFDYIAQLAASGRSVVFLTNAGELDPSAEARLLDLCAGILVRRNIGYDFGGWRDAIETLDLPRAGTEEIIIANDSIFGPIRP
ncbi:MAG: lipopolysaccharide biosynthesis protein, partial [Acidiphilium sp. 37-67-22]